MVTIEMLNEPCDRCGKVADVLHPFKLAETITYRNQVIDQPWLCIKCFVIEKKKWRAQFPEGA